jgi:2-polyprenyl-3-methyl-5-hydroxy-6-metoxy-1,4-benzoquinol methylase
MLELDEYPHIATLVAETLRSWPDHEKYIIRSLANRSDEVMLASDRLCDALIRMSENVPGGLTALCDDYSYFSENVVLPEQLYFQRHGEYRISTFEEANRQFYSNPEFMRRYVNCLAISTALWENHANVFSAYLNRYLPSLEPGSRLMEVGPAHGFAMYFAATCAPVASLTGWDVSPTAIEHTRQVLNVLGVEKNLDLKVQNLFEAGSPPPGFEFDAIVIGEVLEHLEDPRRALRSVAAWLHPKGRMWITTPVNSPFPDHIYLFRTIEETHDLVRECGLEIVDHDEFPMAGTTLEKSIKRKQPISCVITATKPG